MRLRIITLFLLLATGILTVKALEERSSSKPPAEVRFDNTPLERADTARLSSYADVLDQVRPAVVSVTSTRVIRQRQQAHPFGEDPFFRRFFGIPEGEEFEQRRQGLGSGVIVSENGYILTNNHVIDGADEIEIVLSDQRKFDAEIIGTDPKTDVAILKIEADELPVAVLTDSEQIRVGDIAFALGNPLGVGQTVTMGIVSATGRQQMGVLGEGGYENFIQTDAAINQGNSGGPLVDADGRVIGINTAILSRTGGNIGIGFAIPVNLVSNVMDSLIKTGDVQRGYLGVNLQPLSRELAEEFKIPDSRGALISAVVPESPADGAGLRPGDVVVKVDGRQVNDHAALRLMISQMRPGTSPAIEFYRDGELQSVEVELGRLDDQALMAQLGGRQLLQGVAVSPITPELREEFDLRERVSGLVITGVDPQSPYANDLPVGAVIVQVNHRPVASIAEAREFLRPGRNVLLINYRGAQQYMMVLVE